MSLTAFLLPPCTHWTRARRVELAQQGRREDEEQEKQVLFLGHPGIAPLQRLRLSRTELS